MNPMLMLRMAVTRLEALIDFVLDDLAERHGTSKEEAVEAFEFAVQVAWQRDQETIEAAQTDLSVPATPKLIIPGREA